MTIAALAVLTLLTTTTTTAPSTPTFKLTLEHRVRAEALQRDFRRPGPASTDAGGLFFRSLGALDVDAGPLVGTLELIDARAVLTGAPPSTSHVDALDLLQATVGLRLQDALAAGDRLELRLGRQTIDLGTRRLVARNEFRNTITAFTGLDARWQGDRAAARAFVVTPVGRLPDDDALQADPAAAGLAPPWQPDRERGDLLAGAWARVTHRDVDVELTALWLDEGDDGRRLLSPSLLFRRAPRAGAVDFALELMPQLGATATAGIVRERRAFSLHASVGHRLAVPGAPRLALLWDHATGDGPDDGVDERFDPLFGARRFELGPTGLFGPLSRTNLSSPGARLELSPGPAAEVLVMTRGAWLATPDDAWVPGKRTAAVGRIESVVDTFIGAVGEVRLRAWPKAPVVPEVGTALFLPGPFVSDVDGAPGVPSFFAWAQLTARFSS
jgi:hypothetical protein